jgi:aminopeptidase N
MRAYIQSRLTADHSTEGLVSSAPFSAPGTLPVYAPDLSIEPIHLDLQLDVDVPNQTLKAIVTHTVRARAGGPKTLKLNGIGFQDVVVSDPDGAHEVVHSYDGSEIKITWDRAFRSMEERRVTISYVVVKPSSGLYFSMPSDDNPNRPTWAGTDHETERARHWLATIDLPDCHPTVAFTIRHDASLIALANGAPEGEPVELPDGRKESRYLQHQPCPSYLTCFAVGDFISYDDGKLERENDSDISFRYFTTKDHQPADLQRAFGRSKEMMEWMQTKVGMQFPYAKYWQFAVLGIGGAMENISLVSWEDMFVLDETIAKEWEWQVD